ncbi:MAG TPA: glycosyltransferase family 4 protein [Methylomirabilota bacterium]|nr:glycosyltransferase family 4 protein [Methylomirabilota bacterium]
MELTYAANVDLGIEGADTRHLFAVTDRLCARGHRVTLFVPRLRPYRYPTPVAIRPVWTPRLPLLFPVLYQATLAAALRRDGGRPAAVYERGMPLSWASGRFARRRGARYVREVNGIYRDEARLSGLEPWKVRLLDAFEGAALRRADRVVVVTDAIGDVLVARYGVRAERIVTVPNGVDVERVRPLAAEECRRALGLQPEGPYLCFVGTLTPWHGLPELFAALPAVLAEAKTARLLVVGDGPLRPRLLALSERLGLGAAVHFVGAVPRDAVPRWLGAADVGLNLLTPSIVGAPLKLLEYLAAGRPVVSTRAPHFAWVEARGAGILADPEAPAELAEAILSLLRDRARGRAMGETARRVAETEFSWDRLVPRVEGVCFG